MTPLARPRSRGLRRADDAVNEIIGFILMFAISSVVLVVSTQSYLAAQENTDHLLRGVEMRNMASRVSSRVVQTGLLADEFPNATYTALMRVPTELNGHTYEVGVQETKVTVASQLSDLNAEATTYQLGTVPYLTVGGTATGETGWFNVTYTYDWFATPDGPVRDGDDSDNPVYNIKTIAFKKE